MQKRQSFKFNSLTKHALRKILATVLQSNIMKLRTVAQLMSPSQVVLED